LRALDSAEAEVKRGGDAELLLRITAARTRFAPPAATSDQIEPQRDVAREIRSAGVLDRLGGAALREVAAAFGHLEPSIVRAALYRLGLPRTSPTMISDLAKIIAQEAAGNDDRAQTVRGVFASLRPEEVPDQPIDAERWERVIAGVPGLALGRAVAELIGREPRGSDLANWAQSALQARVDRDVAGLSAA
jgi:hypothetical protein